MFTKYLYVTHKDSFERFVERNNKLPNEHTFKTTIKKQDNKQINQSIQLTLYIPSFLKLNKCPV